MHIYTYMFIMAADIHMQFSRCNIRSTSGFYFKILLPFQQTIALNYATTATQHYNNYCEKSEKEKKTERQRTQKYQQLKEK